MRPVLALAVVLALAPAASASSLARNGTWRSTGIDYRVTLVVSKHRVISAKGRVTTEPAASGVDPTGCGSESYSWTGPLSAGSFSTTKRFHLNGDPYYDFDGRIVSSTKIVGSLTDRATGNGDFCAGKNAFTARPTGH